MHDAALVCVRQTVGNLDGVTRGAIDRQRALGQHGAERDTLDELHGDVDAIAGDAGVVDRADVGVIQRRCRPRFAHQPLTRCLVGGAPGRQHLDGEVASQPRVAGTIDLAHAAGAEQADDLVGTEHRSGFEAHRVRLVSALTAPRSSRMR